MLVCASIFVAFVLPNTEPSGDEAGDKPSMAQALRVPSIVLAAYSVACAAASLGFIQATLEPHMRDFDLSPLLVGSMFVISGGCYGKANKEKTFYRVFTDSVQAFLRRCGATSVTGKTQNWPH